MNFNEVLEKYERFNPLFRHKPTALLAVDGLFMVNSYIAIPIVVATSLNRSQTSLPVKDSNNTEIATLYLANNLDLGDISDASDELFALYLCDVSVEDYENGKTLIQSDYVVIKQENWTDYFGKHYETAPIWGGFYHQTQTNIAAPKTTTVAEIIAFDNLQYPTISHQAAAIRAIQQPYVFERFLKKYHLLELLFDYQFAKKVQNHNIDSGVGLTNLIKDTLDYGREDIERLKSVLLKCTDWEKIRVCLNMVFPYRDKAIKIFYTFNKKDNNPLKEEDTFNNIVDFINADETCKLTNNDKQKPLDKIRGSNNPQKIQEATQQRDTSYNDFTLKLTAYWIYRIRSSVAHHKIGEYLMTNDDEGFMLDFAEPLLDELIKQCFKV